MNKFLIFLGILVIVYFVITGVSSPSKKLEAAEVISSSIKKLIDDNQVNSKNEKKIQY